MVKPLTVYKASAGSGKTFTLATEYIKLLIQNPTCYRNILAVTFTNKATEEMKMRILSQLYGIWKGLPDSENYLQHLIKTTDFPRNTISQRAGEALHLLLHNYSYFRVETIDAFFQSVLRNLARELDLTANLRIGLNDVQVEELAVDQLIDSLTHTDVMLQWLLSYIFEKISDDHSWNIIGQIKSFGRTIFQDFYKEHSKMLSEKMTQKDFLESYTKQLKEIRHDAMETMKTIADNFFDALESENIKVDDLPYGKSGVASVFLKIKEGKIDESIFGKRALDCMGDPSKWYGKKNNNPELTHNLAETTLIGLLRKAYDERPRQWRLYQSADLTLKHLNQLRLVGSIEQRVHQLNDDASRFLLSDTQHFLHALINDSDSPFIFEKIGTQLEHIMIDEFQDTSTVQWKNFKVLLEECMSRTDSENLIVGDVKQSIYRWRSGDWRLLNAIDKEFLHADQRVEIRPLETNYRSDCRIVEFNNAFFTEAAKQEFEQMVDKETDGAHQLQQAYSDVCQKVPEHRDNDGFVNITLLPSDNYTNQTFSKLIEIVQHLIEHNVASKEIAILVRTNKHIPLIAEYFSTHLPEVRIVSDEAFRLDASTSVCLFIQALHLLTHPDDLLAKAAVVKLYHKAVLNDMTTENELLIKDRPLDTLLPEAFTQHYEELLQLPLYELVERLYSIFNLKMLNEQSAYLCTFYDQLAKFTQDNSTDIDAFIREWEDTLCSKTIQSDISEGIRILSIHKSKGLEFKYVLVPFCDWRMEIPSVLWCNPTEPPFDALPIIPIDYSEKQMMGTIYEKDYKQEHLQNVGDNLNLLYVAFTRAEKGLFVIGQRGTQSSRSALIETVLPQLKLEECVLTGQDDEEKKMEFTYGSLPAHRQADNKQESAQKAKDKKASENVFLQPVTAEHIDMESFGLKVAFKQSNRSRDFIEGEDEQQQMSYIKMGSVLHEVFANIRTTADIPGALRQMQQDGILYDDEVTNEKLTSMLRKRLEDKRVKEWFSDNWKLFNECSILRVDEEGNLIERRPDRVITDGHTTHVIDFKFGHPRPEYHEQVRDYMQLLDSMGYHDVKGWLWYVYSNKIEEIQP